MDGPARRSRWAHPFRRLAEEPPAWAVSARCGGKIPRPSRFPTAARLYTHHTALHDITAGTNTLPGGSHCGGDYQCHAVPGYDGPTGNGTPSGLAGF